MAVRDSMMWTKRIVGTAALLLAGCSAVQSLLMYFPSHDFLGPVTVGVTALEVLRHRTRRWLDKLTWDE